MNMDTLAVAQEFARVAQAAGLPAVVVPGSNIIHAIVEVNQGPAKNQRVVVESNPLPRIYEMFIEHELGGEWVKVLKVEAEEHHYGDLCYFVVAGLR